MRNKRLPAAEEADLIIGDGERLPVACYGDLDLVLHCERYGKPWSNVRVTLKNVAVVLGIWFDLILFNQIQELWSGPKWAGKADPCFYLNGGNDHASDCDKVMLESGIVSYTTNATYAYRRASFVDQQVTFGNGVIRAPSPPPAATSTGGSGTGGLAGQSRENDAVTAGRTVEGRRHQRSTKSIEGVA